MSSTTIKPSKSNPQYAAMLRRIMLIDAIIKARNEDYDRQLDEFFKKSPKLTAVERDEITRQFTRTFYSEETEALATFEAIKKRHESRIEPSFNGGDAENYEKERYILAMGPEAYVAQSLFSEKSFDSLSKKYPAAAEQLKRDIKKETSFFKDFPASAAHWPATVSLFNKRYPGAQYQLEQMEKEPGGPDELKAERKGLASAALTMLKVGSAAANPSGFLISKAIGGLMKTEAMQPLVSGVTLAVKRVAEKSGLTSAVKSQFSKLSKTQRMVVAGALATVGVTTLVMLGVVDAEKGLEYANNLIEKASDLDIEQGVEYASTLADKALDMVGSGADETDLAAGNAFQSGMLDVPENSGALDNSDIPADDKQTVLQQKNDSNIGDVTQQQQAQNIDTAPTEKVAQPPASVTYDTPGRVVVESANYRILPGDTLSEIVEKRLQAAGIPYDYQTIDFHVKAAAEFNGISDPNLIFSGKTITLPEISGVSKLVSDDAIAKISEATFEKTTLSGDHFNSLINSPLFEKEDPVANALLASNVLNQSLEDLVKQQSVNATSVVMNNDIAPHSNRPRI